MDPKIALEFERSIKVLKRSKLTKTPEFNDMVLASERFYRDARLASLTRKDHNQINQQLEDAQFFSILLGMLGEVAKSAGLKQRDDLRKVYHWYQLNKAVLHCQPHFQSVSTPPNQKPPELKFSPEVIRYYSIPPERRKAKQVEFEDSKNSTITVQDDDAGRKSNTKSPTPRPVTAPPVLNRPKVENTLPPGPKSWKGQQYYIEDSGLSISYINKHLTPKKYMAALDRPSSAMAVVRQYQQSLPDGSYDDDDDELSSDGRVSPLSSTLITGMGSQSNVSVEDTIPKKDTWEHEKQRYYVEEDEEENKASSVDGPEGSDDKGPVEEDIGEGKEASEPPPNTEKPVPQHSFVDDETFGDGDPPDEKKYQMKKIEVSIPAVGDDSSSLASQMNLQKWQEFQQSHSTFQSNSLLANNNEGAFQSETMVVEMPELSTDEVIANYAESKGPAVASGSSKYAPAQPSEDFYQATEKFSPAVNAKKPILKKQTAASVSQTKSSTDQKSTKVYVPGELTADVKIRNALNESSSSQGVHLDSVVDLAGPISDQMVVERESQQEPVEPRLRHRQPAAQIPPPRPHTALGHSSNTHIKIPDGRTRTSPASTPRSSFGSQDSPRSSAGDIFVGYPNKSEYDVHFRRKARPLTAPTHIPYAVQHAPIRPDTTRYRSKSASPKSLRTAGSSSAGGRPRTASSLSGQMWNSKKPVGPKVRVPGAASHSATTIHPLTISAMMSVRYLGGKSSNFREELSPRAKKYWNDEDIPSDLPPNLEFMTISKPAQVYETKAKDESVEEKVAPKPPAETPENTHPPQFQEWSSPQDSIEGLVQMGRVRSERGGGDADSQNGGSLEGSSGRGFSPEPADLSDVEDDTKNEVPVATPREDEAKERNIDEGKEVATPEEAVNVKDGKAEEDKIEQSKSGQGSEDVDNGNVGVMGGEGEVGQTVEAGGEIEVDGEKVDENVKVVGIREVDGEGKVGQEGEEATEEVKTVAQEKLEGDLTNGEYSEESDEKKGESGAEPTGETESKGENDEAVVEVSAKVTDTSGDRGGNVEEDTSVEDVSAKAEEIERSESKGT
ncbi:hypothetical protein HOLleu_30810 [Holothuria leucospilota]|uniref:Uncharacterized protein n=1 Tax=Holothuria leucospilota TaxID=206669 RepID=A0A9Q1GXC3_HOLLE|nr:hypothetical protein HOLleu_30810 [Holothuria leucospilota]